MINAVGLIIQYQPHRPRCMEELSSVKSVPGDKKRLGAAALHNLKEILILKDFSFPAGQD